MFGIQEIHRQGKWLARWDLGRDRESVPPKIFADESFIQSTSGHVYVIGLVSVEGEDMAGCESLLRAAAGKRSRFHYSEATRNERTDLISVVSGLTCSALALVAVSSDGSGERSRRRILAHCFGAMLGFVHGVEIVTFESRGKALDLRDKSLLQSLGRFAGSELPKVRHEGWRHQPMLWAADVIAGSVSRAVASGNTPPFPATWV